MVVSGWLDLFLLGGMIGHWESGIGIFFGTGRWGYEIPTVLPLVIWSCGVENVAWGSGVLGFEFCCIG